MILADFTVAVEYEVPREVRVVVYDSLKGLRVAATRYDNRTRSRRRRRSGEFNETLGICHRFEWRDQDTGASMPLCAIVRLARPHLGAGVVSHELTHATVWMRELAVGDAPLKADDDELFCWVLGELVSHVVDEMYERGVYERNEDEA